MTTAQEPRWRTAVHAVAASALAAGILATASAEPLPSAAKLGASSVGLESNAASILVVSGDTLWVAAERTVSRLDGPGTSQFDFTTYDLTNSPAGSDEAITALAAQGNRLAAATYYSALTDSGTYASSNGLYLSDDGGVTWENHPIVEIMKDRDGMRLPGGENLCFGIWFEGGNLWSSWTSDYVAMTPDFGTTWYRYRPDSTNNPVPNPLLDDPQNFNRYLHLNYRAYDGATSPDRGSGSDTIWVATNAGLNRSADGGTTWNNYDALDGALTGDFVPAVRVDTTSGIVWVATQATGIDEGNLRTQVINSEYDRFPDGVIDSLDWDLDRDNKLDESGSSGVSWSTDGGATWQQMLPVNDPNIGQSFLAYNFAFDGAGTVWIAGTYSSSDALLMSPDNGATWEVQPIRLADGTTVSSNGGTGDVAYLNGVLWAATGRGLARSDDHGETWTFVLRYPQARALDTGSVLVPTGPDANKKTYAFPSPSAPLLGSPPNIVFALAQSADVTIRIYDAGGGLVRVLDVPGLGSGNHTVTWDGQNGEGRSAANGVYLYEVKTNGGDSAHGKFMVLN